MYRLELEIHDRPRIMSNGSHGNWRAVAAEKRKWHQIMQDAVITSRNIPVQPLKRAKCTFIRVSTRQPDDDNLRISFKTVRDALKKCGIIEDDSPEHMPDPIYLWERGAANDKRIKVIVEEAA